MTGTVPKVLLWLFVVNLGIAFGAGLYESRIVFPDWLTIAPDGGTHWNADAAQRHDTGIRFWAFVTTMPLTLLTFANLFAAWRATGSLRAWWLTASGAALADRIFTFAYFIPTMIGLTQAPDSSEAVATAMQWANLNVVRHALVLTAWLAAMQSFAVLHQQR